MGKLKNKYKISITGLNMHHLLYYLENGGFNIENLSRKTTKNIEFIIPKENFKVLKKAEIMSAYKIKILRSYGVNNFIRKITNKLGLIFGIVICITFMLNTSSSLTNITFEEHNHNCSNGSECIFSLNNKKRLYEVLETQGIKEGAKINSLPSNKQVEQLLMNEFEQISGVTLSKRGSILNIKIVEGKLSHVNNGNLESLVNGIIVSAEVTSGKLRVKPGDFVLKGNTLVEQVDNKKICAKLTIRTFYHDFIIYDQEQVSYQSTGKTQNVSTISVFGKTFQSCNKIKFDVYETKSISRYAFLNLFCPLKVQTTTYYELTPTYKTIPFDDVEQELKANLYNKIKQTLPLNAIEKNTTYATFSEESRTRLDCYIEALLEINL